MFRMIALIAFALLASTVSAQTSNIVFYNGATNCTTVNATSVTWDNSTSIPTNNACSLVNNTIAQNTYVKAWCNNATGVVTVTLFSGDALCNATSASNATISSAQCNIILGETISFTVAGCPIVSSPTNSTPTTPTNTTGAPTPTTPTNTTGAPTPTPGAASQQAALSMIAAAAVIVLAVL